MHRQRDGAIRMWRLARGALLATTLAVAALVVAPTSAFAGNWGATVSETNLDGRVEQFWVGSDGAVYHAWATTPGGPVNSGARSLGGHVTSGIGVGRNEDGRIEIFGRADGGDINHNWQVTPGGNWSGWYSLGYPPGGEVKAYSGVYGRNFDGLIRVQITDDAGVTRYKWQQYYNCCWTDYWTTTQPF